MKKNGLVIIYNGEIYNFKDLKKDLVSKGIVFDTNSDTEVVLELFRMYGKESLNMLRGMFAFAIYDEVRKSLLLARDHFGIKPLFYTNIDNGIAFSSELKTLCKIPGFNKTLNEKSILSAINYLWLPGNESIFMNTKKLPPAHYMEIDEDQNINIQRYWELDDKKVIDEKNDLVRVVHQKFDESVKMHLISDVGISSFLSGGLDSSLVSVIAKKYSDPSTYTIATNKEDKKIEQMPEDEIYASKLADQYKFNHHEIEISSNIVDMLPKIVSHLDEPIGDPAAINTFLICNKAKENNEKVLLSGMGADEIFFGYRRHKAFLYAQTYKKLPKVIRNIISFMIKAMPVKIFGIGLKLSRWAKKFDSIAKMSDSDSYMQSYSYYDPSGLVSLMNPSFHKHIDELREDHKRIFNSKYKGDIINQICHTDINMFLNGLNLVYTDRASMAASTEVRVPFVDVELIEFAMSIPGKYKFKNNESKYILKKAAEIELPREIIYRKKASFGAPIRSWISNDLKSMVDEVLSEENVANRGIFNYAEIKRIIDNDRSGKEDNAYRIYQFLTLELWMREFIDKD